MSDTYAIARSGLDAMSATVAATANNIANLDTDGYKSRRVDLATAGDGQGVQVAGISVDTSPGALRPDYTDTSATTMDTADAVNISDQGRAMVETSNVDLATQMVSLVEASRGFEANVAVILTQEDMAGTILDLRV